MVVVAIRLHFHVLPERGEAQSIRHPHVVQKSLLSGWGIDAVRPVPLQCRQLTDVSGLSEWLPAYSLNAQLGQA